MPFDYRFDYQNISEKIKNATFLLLPEDIKKAPYLIWYGVSLCGSNRTRTYDTPGMKREPFRTLQPYFSTVSGFIFSP
jgi:hypothetical protein